MTRQEALEYLNLPLNSSDSLVRKRYLELHEDYQKAINNAPSEHFRDLYRENLDKIEEAYLLMKELTPGIKEAASILTVPLASASKPSANPVQQNIQEAQDLVDTFLTSSKLTNENLDKLTQSQILNYIDQISSLQDFLKDDKNQIDKPNGIIPEVPVAAVFPAITTDQPLEVQDQPTNGIEELLNNNDVVENGNGHTLEPITPPPESPVAKEPEPNPEPISDVVTSEPVLITPTIAPDEGPVPPPIDPTEETTPESAAPIPKHSETTPEKVTSSRSSLESYFLKDNSYKDRNRSFNRILLGTIFLALLAGIAGGFYIIYPLLYPPPVAENGQVLVDSNEETSIAQIVGDEFFRTGNYLEALVQYTLAVADDPDNPYLLQRMDSCKVILSSSTLLTPSTEVPQEETPTIIENTQPIPTEPITNSANRFRGEDPIESKSFVWSEWATDDQLKEEVINSARSAQLSKSNGEEALDSTEFTEAKTSGGPLSETDEDDVKNFVDKKPEPIGGWKSFKKFTQRRIRYPSAAYKAKVSGMVLVQFIVNKDGTIRDIEIAKGIGFGCDKEALRVVGLYKGWNPGELNGEIVNTKAFIPINFKFAN